MSVWPLPSVVASTVAGLGSKEHGKIGVVRVGSSPYDFIALVYDATLGKWVSPSLDGPLGHTNAFTSTATTYTAVTDTNAGVLRKYLPEYKNLYDAGLRLQVRNTAQLTNSGSNTSFLAVSLFETNDGDVNVTQIGTTPGGEISLLGATSKYTIGAWADFNPAAPSKTMGVLIVQVKVSAGTGTFGATQVRYRYVG